MKRYESAPRPPGAGSTGPPSGPSEDTLATSQSQPRIQYFSANVQGVLATINTLLLGFSSLAGWGVFPTVVLAVCLCLTQVAVAFLDGLTRIILRWLPLHYAAHPALHQHEITTSSHGDVRIRPATPAIPEPATPEAVADDRPRLVG